MKNLLLSVILFVCCFTFASAQNIESLINDFIQYRDAGQNEQAIDVGNKLLILSSNMGEEYASAIILGVMAECYSNVGNYSKAIESESQALEIRKRLLGEIHPENAMSLKYLASYYYAIGDSERAIENGKKALYIQKQLFGETNSEVAATLNFLACYYYALGDYTQAIETGTQALKIQKQVLGENHPDYATSLNDLSCYYSALGQYEKAIELGTKSLVIRKQLLGENHIDYATTLNYLAINYSSLGNYTKALELGAKALEIIKSILGENHPDYIALSSNLASYHASLGNLAKTVELDTQYMDIDKDILGMNELDYAEWLSKLGIYYDNLGDYANSVVFKTKAMEIYRQVLGEQHPDFAISMNNLALSYSHMGNYEKAIELGTQVLEIQKDALGQTHPDYASSLCNLATYYSYYGDYSKAIELGKKALDIRKQVLGENHPDYALSLNNLATEYANLGDYKKAIELAAQALQIRKVILGENNLEYAISLSNQASNYAFIGNYPIAINLMTQVLEIRKQIIGNRHPDYAKTLSNLASCYSHMGNYSKGIELGTQALEIRKQILGETHPDYATSLANLASDYSNIGDYTKAVELGKRALEIRKQVLGDSHPLYASSLSNVASYYSCLGDLVKAKELDSLALKIRKQLLGEQHPDYAISLNNIASHYDRMGNHTKAIEIRTQALEAIKKALGENNPFYAVLLANLGSEYADIGEYNQAIELSLHALEIRKRSLGERHPDNAGILCFLSQCYFSIDPKKAIKYLVDCMDISQSYLLSSLSSLTSVQRSVLWNKYYYLYNIMYPLIMAMEENHNLVGDLYDKSCLFSKGLILASETEMRKLIIENGDETTVAMFNELKATWSWLNKLYERPIAERHVNTDSLEDVADRLEADLVRMSKTYGNFMHNLKLTWKDVQAKLGDNDIAVEFLSFPVIATNNTMNIALTVRKGYDAPHMVRLFEDSEMNAIKSICYSSNVFSRLVWGRMAEELEGVKNIYFSPSGELYNIAIESMPHWEQDCMISDRFNLYRLSSTRELAISQDETMSNGAVVYGGIKYNTNVASMGTPKSDAESQYILRGFNADSTNYRGTKWSYLPGTLTEANEIETLLVKGNTIVSKLVSDNATEASFKELSGEKKRILHIATHGFFWNDSTAKTKKEDMRLRFVRLDDNQPRYVEDKAMTRSGLLFVGAQNTFDGIEIPAGVDDGVLTAQEISFLDLRGLDLLVLSACQTGLGDIKGDGVFGLQRGFKKAGTRSILMSLWKVDDFSTRLLMKEFYRHYVSGETKQKSLKLAQKFVREYVDENGNKIFADPSYWASWILLDALD